MLCDANVATALLGNSTKAQTYGQVASQWIPPEIVVKIGRTIRFKENELREFIKRGGTKTKEGSDENESTNANFTLITGFWRGQGYALVAAKKRWMQPYQLGSLLRQMIKFDIGELEGRDLYVPAPPQFLNDAVALAVYLFDRPELAVAA
jgi:hypothetical protein